MNNFEQAVNATNEALNSSGATMKQNEVYMQSLEAKVQALKTSFESLVLGDGGLTKVAKAVVSFGTFIVDLINKLGGLQTIAIAVGVVLVNVFGATIVTAITSFGGAILSAIGYLTVLIIQEGLATTATTLLSGALNLLSANPIVAIGVALGATLLILNKFKNSLNDSKNTYAQANTELSETNAELKSINEQIAKLKAKGTLSLTDKQELLDLRMQREELEKIQKIQQREKDKAQRKYEKKAKKTVYQEVKIGGTVVAEDRVQAVKTLSATMLKHQEIIDELSAKKEDGTATKKELKLLDEEIKAYNQASDMAGEYVSQLEEETSELDDDSTTKQYANEATIAYANAIGQISEATANATGNTSNLQQDLNSLKEVYGLTDEQISEVVNNMENYEDDVYATADALGFLSDETEEAVSTLEDLISTISGTSLSDIASSFNTARKAMQEMDKTGKMSIGTFEEFMSLQSPYISAMIDEEGQLKASTNAEYMLYDAKIDEMAITQARSLVSYAVQVANSSESAGYAELAGNIDKATASGWSLVYMEIAQADVSDKDRAVLIKQVQALRSMATEAKKAIRNTNGYTDAVSGNTDALKENAEALQEEVNKYEKVISYIEGKIDDEIERLGDLKDAAVDSIEAQIKALQSQRDEEEQFWNDKIDALNAQNDALEDQLKYEQLLEALAKSKSKKIKIYREGQGFIYETDQNAVNEAQDNLDEYTREKALKDATKALEDARDEKLKIYDEEIENLNNYKDEVEANYDAQIKYYQDWKKQFKKQVNAYEDEQNRLLALELTGIDFENENWKTRLSNLNTFVANYKKKLEELAEAQAKANVSTTTSTYKGNSKNTTQERTDKYWTYKELGSFAQKGYAQSQIGVLGGNDVIEQNGKWLVIKWGSGYTSASDASRISNQETKLSSGREKYGYYKRYASGVASVSGNQVALVGDAPYQELALGARANGVLTSLENGGGVVNATSTRTLAGILNQLGSYAKSNFGASTFSSNSSAMSNATNITIGSISLPEVKDGKGFVDYLQNFSIDMIQKSYA